MFDFSVFLKSFWNVSFRNFQEFFRNFFFFKTSRFLNEDEHVKMIFAKKRRKNEEMSKTKKINIEIIQ